MPLVLISLLIVNGETVINVKRAADAPSVPNSTAIVGSAGEAWKYFPSLCGRVVGDGVVMNAKTIKDSSGATLSCAAMTTYLSNMGVNHSPVRPSSGSLIHNPQHEVIYL